MANQQRVTNALVADDNDQWNQQAFAALQTRIQGNTITEAAKRALINHCTALTEQQRNALNRLLAPDNANNNASNSANNNAYVPKKQELVASVKASMQAKEVKFDYEAGALISVTSGVVDIGAAYRACKDLEICRNIAAMTPAISAALANDDAPWAAATYGTLTNNNKIALTAYVKQLKTMGDPAGSLITMFNRCGYILASQSRVAGCWAQGSPNIAPNEPASWFGHVQRISAFGGKASEIGQKKLNAQTMWAITHKNEL